MKEVWPEEYRICFALKWYQAASRVFEEFHFQLKELFRSILLNKIM
jgi:hypothetical protein